VEKQKWYYTSLAEIFTNRLTEGGGKEMVEKYNLLVSEVYGNG